MVSLLNFEALEQERLSARKFQQALAHLTDQELDTVWVVIMEYQCPSCGFRSSGDRPREHACDLQVLRNGQPSICGYTGSCLEVTVRFPLRAIERCEIDWDRIDREGRARLEADLAQMRTAREQTQ